MEDLASLFRENNTNYLNPKHVRTGISLSELRPTSASYIEVEEGDYFFVDSIILKDLNLKCNSIVATLQHVFEIDYFW